MHPPHAAPTVFCSFYFKQQFLTR